MFVLRLLPLLAIILATGASAQETGFDTVALQGGGEVVIRYGSPRQVIWREGDAAHSRVTTSGSAVTIDNCRLHCPRGYHLRLEVVTPHLGAVSVLDGGVIRVADGFPSQAGLEARVAQGGAIDLRPLRLGQLDAAVESGGTILARVDGELVARVAHGGRIQYWGRPRVRQSVRDGGVIASGRDEDLESAMLNPRPPPIPPVPPIPRLKP